MRATRYELIEERYRRALRVIDAAGVVLFRPSRQSPAPLAPPNVRSLLVLMTYGLGDAVLATGCLRALREAFPQAKIDAVVGPRSREIVATFPYFDELIYLDNPLYRLLDGRPAGFAAARATLAELRRRRYDVCLDLLGDLPNCWLAWRTGAARRVAHDSMGGGFFLTDPVPRDPARQRQSAVMAEALAPLGIASAHPPELFVRSEDEKAAARALADTGDAPLVVVAPGALLPAKKWPAAHFARLIDLLRETMPLRAVLVGAPADARDAAATAAATKEPVLNLCGKLRLTPTIAVLKRARLFVGNDSGLTHATAALGVPVAQIFGPGLPERFGHHGPRDTMIFQTQCPFYPCSPRFCRAPDRWCMAAIAPEQVAAAIRARGAWR